MRFNFFTICVIIHASSFWVGESYALRLSDHGFVENKGQIVDQHNNPNSEVLYLLNNPGLNVQLRKMGFSYDVYSVEYKSNPHHLILTSDSHSIHNHSSDSLTPEFHIHRIDFSLEATNPNYIIVHSDPLPDYFNYFTASAPPEGIKKIGQYSKITYQNIYPAP